MFTKGFYVIGFDLKSYRDADEEHIILHCQGKLRIEARFKKPLPDPVTCIWYAQFPRHVKIDIPGDVTLGLIPFKFIFLNKHLKYFQ